MTNLELISVLCATSLTGSLLLGIWSRRLAARARLRRRLGRLGDAHAALVVDHSEVSIASRLLAGTGLGWTAGQLVARLLAVVTVGIVLGIGAGSAALSVTATMGGVAGLLLLLRKARARRMALCDEQMPQALEIVSLALRAGHALPGAMALAADECPAPLSDELRRLVRENSLGRPMSEVIVSFATRLAGCAAVETFAVAVLVLQETGGNLINVLERIVESARARASYRARLRALTSEGRQSAKLLAALPAVFAGLAISVDPTYLETMRTPGGLTIAAIAVGMWIAGILWVRQLIKPLS